MQGEDTPDDKMPDNDNRKIGRGVIGAVMMQGFTAVGTCVIDLEVLPKQRTFAALGTALREPPPHGMRYIATWPVGDHYRHGKQLVLAQLKVDDGGRSPCARRPGQLGVGSN